MKVGVKLLAGAIAASAALAAVPASAAPIVGSFSLVSFSGSFVGGTALTATGLDFGAAFGSTGNGYGSNGTALVGNATGSFAGLTGTLASISDISLAVLANPYVANPFVSFAGSNLALTFSNASYTRSSLGTSVTITGLGTFVDGIAADASTGMFSLAASSQRGSATSANFTFTSNASSVDEPITTAVPEPATWAMMLLGFGVIGFGLRSRRKAGTKIRFA